jgi:hypothetical protein
VTPLWRGVLVASALLLLPSGILQGQERLDGRVLLEGRPQAAAEIALHRVTRDTAGVVGRQRSAPDGTFSFPLPARDPDDFQVFFTTVDHLGVRHFGPAVHPGEVPERYEVQLHDTARVAAGTVSPARVVQRDLIVMQDGRGGWEVNEIVRLENPLERTLVGDPGQAVAEFQVPAAIEDFSVGEPDDEAGDLLRMGQRVLLASPLLPGTREVFVRYRIPASPSSITLPLQGSLGSVNLFVRQPSPELSVSGLEPAGLIQAEGERFLRFSGPGGGAVELSWSAPRLPFVSPTTVGVVALALLLAVGLLFALRRPRRPAH